MSTFLYMGSVAHLRWVQLMCHRHSHSYHYLSLAGSDNIVYTVDLQISAERSILS